MAAIGAEVVTSGVVSFLLLLLLFLLLSILLTPLCSDCNRHSFELRDPEADKDPSALIRVVKLEEAAAARENPMINEIQNDEKDVRTNGSAVTMKTGSETTGEGNPEEENSVQILPWRSHLNQGVNGSAPPDHTYHTIGEGSSPLTNQEPGEEHSARPAAAGDSMYARVSKKNRQTTPPDQTPKDEEEEEEEEEEESSPPLPHRMPQLEG